MTENLFELRGIINKKAGNMLMISGAGLLLSLWLCISFFGWINKSLLPSPVQILQAIPDMYYQDDLIKNILYSVRLNLLGYLEAIVISIPIGYIMGLFPLFREMFLKILNAFRFLPITAVTCLFIVWFGIYDNVKIQFLAFGIIVYLIPTVTQRVFDQEQVHVDTAKTLGATNWQIIKYVFFPGVLSKLFDDIRVLVAISWTYIIVAEMLNKTGGVGSMISMADRQSRPDKTFAILFIIIMIGILQDYLFKLADRLVFPHKYDKIKRSRWYILLPFLNKE